MTDVQGGGLSGICPAGSCQWCGCTFRKPSDVLYHHCAAMQEAREQDPKSEARDCEPIKDARVDDRCEGMAKPAAGDASDSQHGLSYCQDHELVLEVVSDVGDTVQVWRVLFPDPNPVRLRVIDDDGKEAEAWLSDGDSTALSRALEVIK